MYVMDSLGTEDIGVTEESTVSTEVIKLYLNKTSIITSSTKNGLGWDSGTLHVLW